MLSTRLFVTESVFYAFIDRAHPKHTTAAAFFRYFSEEEYSLFTDTTTLIQTYRQIFERISKVLAKDFLRTIAISNINVLYPQESDFKAAIKAMVTYRSTELSFDEALSLVLANRQRISQICTFDYFHPLFGLTLFYLPV